MANHKSAEKRDRQSKVRRMRNRVNKTRMKSVIRSFEEAVASGSVEDARAALKVAVPVIEKTANKGTIHRRTAARKVSRLTLSINKMEAAA